MGFEFLVGLPLSSTYWKIIWSWLINSFNSNSLIAQLKSLKIKLLKNSEKELSVHIDKIISSLLKDTRYKKYKRNFSDKSMAWLFKSEEDLETNEN